MQVKLFTIPVGDSGAALQEMNAFLRGNKILEFENQLVSNEHGAYWCFCVHYIEQAYPKAGGKKGGKVDYRKVLDEAVFQKFSKLREIRKKVAATCLLMCVTWTTWYYGTTTRKRCWKRAVVLRTLSRTN